MRVLVLLGLLLCTACSHNSNIVYYLYPPEATSGVRGTIKRHDIGSDEAFFISAIDGHFVKFLKSSQYNENIPIMPGVHAVLLSFRQGDNSADIPVRLDVGAGSNYIINGEVLDKFLFTPSAISIWVENNVDNAVIDEKYFSKVSRPATMVVPIYIHK